MAQGVYVFLFIKELIHLIAEANTFSESEIMLLVLGLVDVVMIANLLIMVIIGGYETFFSRLNLKEHPDQPQWLAHVNATTMKIKLSMGIDRYFIDTSAKNIHQCRVHDRKYHQMAGHHPPGLYCFRNRHGSDRLHHEQEHRCIARARTLM
ncbi:MAG: YqhA family protein [Arenicellales bacterium]